MHGVNPRHGVNELLPPGGSPPAPPLQAWLAGSGKRPGASHPESPGQANKPTKRELDSLKRSQISFKKESTSFFLEAIARPSSRKGVTEDDIGWMGPHFFKWGACRAGGCEAACRQGEGRHVWKGGRRVPVHPPNLTQVS